MDQFLFIQQSFMQRLHLLGQRLPLLSGNSRSRARLAHGGMGILQGDKVSLSDLLHIDGSFVVFKAGSCRAIQPGLGGAHGLPVSYCHKNVLGAA